MTELFVKARTQLARGLPFVLFCKPDSDRIVGLFQKNDHLYFLEDFNEKGFAFVPFEANSYPYIPLDFAEVMVEKIHFRDYFVDSVINETTPFSGKDFFENLVGKAIETIEEGLFEKVVLSRREIIELPDFDFGRVFKRLVSNYSTAFRYCFYHPKVGMWMGATPEQLLQFNGNSLKTVALAGTQKAGSIVNAVWTDKERIEQQLVTDYIVDNLSENVREITVSSPTTVKAGNLLHIKTDISAKIKTKRVLKKIITSLHPTPAVCGFPKQTAKEFILRHEGYEREYYSGFLGEMNIDLETFKTLQTDLFVNLRCMKVVGNKASIFVGCGITKDSQPKDEYLETVNKSMTMKKML